jgi:hypothetical protein
VEVCEINRKFSVVNEKCLCYQIASSILCHTVASNLVTAIPNFLRQTTLPNQQMADNERKFTASTLLILQERGEFIGSN